MSGWSTRGWGERTCMHCTLLIACCKQQAVEHHNLPPPADAQPPSTRAKRACQACLAEQRQSGVGPSSAAPADGAASERIPPVCVLMVLPRDVHRVSVRVLACHVPANVCGRGHVRMTVAASGAALIIYGPQQSHHKLQLRGYAHPHCRAHHGPPDSGMPLRWPTVWNQKPRW